MTSPKHLWSGDWQEDSAALAEERARRRAQTVDPVEPPEPPEPSRLSIYARALALLRRLRPRVTRPNLRPRPTPRVRRVALLVAIAALLVAGAAYGLSALGGSSATGAASTTANASRSWLGVQTESLPVDRVLVSGVVPGSPADKAGLGPGDLINKIDNRPVSSPGDVEAMIGGLHPGDHVRIEVQRGPLTYTAQATLAASPSNSP
jgi:hypothetical protein